MVSVLGIPNVCPPASATNGATAQAAESPDVSVPAAETPSPEAIKGMNVHEKISWVMRESRSLPKTQWNPEGNFAYAGHDQVIDMIRQLLAKYGLNIYQEAVDYERQPTMGGVGHYTIARYRYDVVNIHRPRDRFKKFQWGEAYDDSDKGLNKCSTISEKVFLLRLFKIATYDDPDANTASRTDPKAAPASSGNGVRKPDGGRFSPTKDCQVCSQPICTAQREGRMWQASEVIATSRKQFQKTLCVDCLLAAQKKAAVNGSSTTSPARGQHGSARGHNDDH